MVLEQLKKELELAIVGCNEALKITSSTRDMWTLAAYKDILKRIGELEAEKNS